MYSESSKILISQRVGWNFPTDSLFPIDIDPENRIATSGRLVNSFHQLATVDNVFHTINETLTTETIFNQELKSIRFQAAVEVMNRILDQHPCYDYNKDYDTTIEKYKSLFDEPLGNLLAIKCLELFVSSGRSNSVERNSKLSYQLLKVELEGVKNEQGFLVSQGLNMKFYSSIKKAQKILFPEPILIIGGNEW